MKKILIISILIIASTFYCVTFAICAGNKASIEDKVRHIANETRKSLPMLINDEIQATCIGAVGKTLINKYNFTKKTSLIDDLPQLKKYYYKNTVNGACSNPDIVSLMDSGVSFLYEYYDVENIFVMKYVINKDICQRSTNK